MPSLPAHIPNARQRSILQSLIKNSPEARYHAVGNPGAIETMIKKGWIVRTAEGPARLEITDAGRKAMLERL